MLEDSPTVVNDSGTALRVCFEPWADILQLPVGHSRLGNSASSPQPGKLEVTKEDDFVWVYTWPGATAKVYDRSAILIAFDIAVPELPPGMSMKSFVDFMGGPAA